MDQVFGEILGTPGVLGLFVFSPPDKVLANTLASRLDGPGLINSGKLLQRIHSATRMNIADVSELLLFYEEALLLVTGECAHSRPRLQGMDAGGVPSGFQQGV